jgi:hypothetical protein
MSYTAKYVIGDLTNMGIDLAGTILDTLVQFVGLIILVGVLGTLFVKLGGFTKVGKVFS